MDKETIIPSMKTYTVLLDEVDENKVNQFILSKVDVNNCLVFYYLSNAFNHSVPGKALAGLVQSCFPMVAENNNFLELDFISLRKILSSDQLNIDTEL